jgi:MtN3 and saliva related transmembrane protein
MSALIGWLSSVILVVTIINQVLRQWRSGTSEGISGWLFVGQLIASSGFTTYSVLVGDWVFIVTNGLLVLANIAGLTIVRIHRRREQPRKPEARAQPRGAAPRTLEA